MSALEKKCTECNEDFLIIDQESAFYNEKGLPLPEKCPLCRQKRSLSLRSEQRPYGSKCDKCGKDIVIAFKPPEDQKVFCKKCYLDYFEGFDPVTAE